MKKRISIVVCVFMVIGLFAGGMPHSVRAATLSKTDIASGCNYDINYRQVMRYRDSYVGDYVFMPVMLGSKVTGVEDIEYQAAEITGYNDYFASYEYDFDECFIIRDKKTDSSLSWVEGDMILIYGKYIGTKLYYSTNRLTDKKIDDERPVIDVYYDDLTYDPLNDWENIMIQTHYNPVNDSSYYDYSDPGDTGDYDEYVLWGSDCEYIDKSYISSLTNEELRIARNEIYARHGRMFNSDDLQNYFNSKSWYSPRYSPDEFNAMGDSMLNAYEKANRDAIAAEENRRK
ncbi:YARHG domain-containing protein [Butyrivibrio sp. AD3002]|uniref:YARHG domain-containing protein n=1 Tax=Butyrivibrio sp. AD3002 TaxID=1280670 RepID=UPI0003B3988B|nr:YARHG domain-containing protein [Butyrivibrio sp. AD3002]